MFMLTAQVARASNLPSAGPAGTNESREGNGTKALVFSRAKVITHAVTTKECGPSLPPLHRNCSDKVPFTRTTCWLRRDSWPHLAQKNDPQPNKQRFWCGGRTLFEECRPVWVCLSHRKRENFCTLRLSNRAWHHHHEADILQPLDITSWGCSLKPGAGWAL